MSIYDHDFDEFMSLMKKTTENLKKMNLAQAEMRWQFGEPNEYEDFIKEMNIAGEWISSHC